MEDYFSSIPFDCLAKIIDYLDEPGLMKYVEFYSYMQIYVYLL